MEKQNLTLSLEASLLKRARKYALDRDTTVNQMVRDFLAGLNGECDELENARKELREIFKKSRYRIGKRNWAREELYDRR